jgi:hypothetical protein
MAARRGALARALVLIVLVVLCACSRKKKDAPTLPTAPPIPVVDGGVVIGKPVVGAPRELAARLRAKEVLGPDRRFLRALAQVDRVMGRPVVKYEASSSNDGHWLVRAGSPTAPVVADVPNMADYGPLMEAVKGHAARDLS